MPDTRPRILVLAGTNGAGKSSIGGAFLRGSGGAYFNPDEVARTLRADDPGIDGAEANSRAWAAGKRLLEEAIRDRTDFAFETTLGGSTITSLLLDASRQGFAVRVWYAGLAAPELHIARVAARVRGGGHDIPERDIRRRYDQSRRNLIRLLPHIAELTIYDNSTDADPAAGAPPALVLVLHMREGRILGPADLAATPAWAQAIVTAARRVSPPQVPT